MIVEFVKDEGFVYYCEQDGDLSGEYVGLSDYTALAAEHEQLREAYQKLITSRAALAAENERLREILTRFLEIGPGVSWEVDYHGNIEMGDKLDDLIEAARAALARETKGN